MSGNIKLWQRVDWRQKKGPLALWIWLVMLGGVMVATGTMFAFLLSGGPEAPVPMEPEAAMQSAAPGQPLIPGLWQIPVMEIRVSVEEGVRLPLRLGIAILAGEGPEGLPALLRHREKILVAIRNHLEAGRAENWERVSGKLKLKYELTDLVEKASGVRVQGLYITDFTILWPT